MLHLTTLNSFVQLLNHNFAELIEHAGHVDGQVGKLELTQNYPEFPLPVVLDCSQIQLRHVYCKGQRGSGFAKLCPFLK